MQSQPDDDPLADPDVVAALRRIAATTRSVCPDCERREVDEPGRRCGPCAHQRVLESKRRHWHSRSNPQATADDIGALDAAARWLRHRLRRGAEDSRLVKRDADAAGISLRTLQRAREQLQAAGDLEVERKGLRRGATRWRLTSTRPHGHT